MSKSAPRMVGLVSVVALGMILATASAALAHSGGLAKDGCHRDRAAGERHFHFEDTTDVAGTCIKEDGKTVRIPNVPATQDALMRLRADLEALSLRVAMLEADAIAEMETASVRTKLEAYNFCSAEIGKDDGLWSSDVDKYCQDVPSADVDDFVSCFATQRGNGAWGSDANERCRRVLGIE